MPLAEGASLGRSRDGGGSGCSRLPAWPTAVFPWPRALTPGPVPDALGEDPLGVPGPQACSAGPTGGWRVGVRASVKAASRELRGVLPGSSWCASYHGSHWRQDLPVTKLQDSRRVLLRGSVTRMACHRGAVTLCDHLGARGPGVAAPRTSPRCCKLGQLCSWPDARSVVPVSSGSHECSSAPTGARSDQACAIDPNQVTTF